jgi:Flp pilus assembly protein TadD
MADAYNAKGVILTRRRQYDEALMLFRKALELNPGDAGFRINVALAYHLQGRGDDAQQVYREAVQINRDFAGVLDFLTQKGPAPATTGDPSVVDPLKRLTAQKAYDDGAAYLRLKAFDKALDALDRALTLDPNNADAYNAKGVVLTRQRKYGEAVQLYQKAVQLDPKNAGYHINLAISYHLQGRKDDALREYQRAVQLDPAFEGQLGVFEE